MYKDLESTMSVSKIIRYIAAGLALSTLLWGSFYTVDQGERAVILRNGAVINEVSSGLHFKLPFFDSAKDISVQERNRQYTKIEAYSKDQQPADLTVSVNYTILNPTRLYSMYGSEDGFLKRILDTRVPTDSENTFGQYTAIEAVQKSTQLNVDLTAAVRVAVGDAPVRIESAQIMNKVFSKNYETAVENRMQAVVQQEQALSEKQRTITQADAAAYQVTAKADADAHQIEVVGKATAGAIRARGDALRDNPALVALTSAERWNGVLPTTMVPNGATPFISVTK